MSDEPINEEASVPDVAIYAVIAEAWLDPNKPAILVKYPNPVAAFESPLPARSRIWTSRVHFIGNAHLNQYREFLDQLPAPTEGTDENWPTVRKGALWDLLLSKALTPEQAAQLFTGKGKENGKMASKKEKAPKAAKPAKAESTEAPADKKYGRLNKDATIKILVDKNPKREGSAAHGRFAMYRNGMKVSAFIDGGGTAVDIGYDLKKGYIKLEGNDAPADADSGTDASPAPETDQPAAA